MCSAEALIRWRHPTKGLILPDQFIPFAEETGAIINIGEWMIEAACKEAVKWPSSVKVAISFGRTTAQPDQTQYQLSLMHWLRI